MKKDIEGLKNLSKKVVPITRVKYNALKRKRKDTYYVITDEERDTYFKCKTLKQGDVKMPDKLDNACSIEEFRKSVTKKLDDVVNHPSHYCSDPSGIECIQITKHRNFCIGNAIKYLFRAGIKNKDTHIEDLEKAIWYINCEIDRLMEERKKELDNARKYQFESPSANGLIKFPEDLATVNPFATQTIKGKHKVKK